MAKLTNAQLTAQLEAANAAYERLAAERDSLRAECEALRAQQPKPRAQYAAPADLTTRRAAMAAAKAEAARTGRSVRAW